MQLPQITEETLEDYANEKSLQRGNDYYEQGAVLSLVRRDMTLYAEVEGSEALPYEVCCDIDPDGSIDATCSCPYDWGGWCKHIVATCLTYIHDPETIQEKPALESLLANRNRDQLQSLIVKLVQQEPSLIRVIEREVMSFESSLPKSKFAASAHALDEEIEVDAKAIHRQIKAIIRNKPFGYDEDYEEIDEVVEELREILKPALKLIEADNGRNALTLLRAITEGCATEWSHLDDEDGLASVFLTNLANALAEALLSADLGYQEREWWAAQSKKWGEKLEDYLADEDFEMAAAAASQGWDYPPLLRVFAGNITEQGAWDGEVPGYADDLAQIRLKVLKRQERYQDYLYLAEAESQSEHYISALIHFGRIQEALDYGRQHLNTPQQIQAVCQDLYDHGAHEQCLQFAEHGLTLQPGLGKLDLMKWLRDQAFALRKKDLAIETAERILREEQNLQNYLQIAEIAGEQWPERQATVLEDLRHKKSFFDSGRIDIFLHEGLIDDAIAIIDSSTYYTTVQRVVEAALPSRPDWVIQACKEQAEAIFNKGRTNLYDAAVKWLEKARTAFQSLDRENEWKAYLQHLLILHQRKYTLVPKLQRLR